MWLSDDQHKVFSIFLPHRPTAIDMSDSYSGNQDFIKMFESGLVEYEQIFGACASFSENPICVLVKKNTFTLVTLIYLFECASRSWRRIGIYGFIL